MQDVLDRTETDSLEFDLEFRVLLWKSICWEKLLA